MLELESPTRALDLRDPLNCVNIAMAKPGETIRLIVSADENATAGTPLDAMGTLSHDGKSFSVVVITDYGGLLRYDFSYRDLLETVSDLG